MTVIRTTRAPSTAVGSACPVHECSDERDAEVQAEPRHRAGTEVRPGHAGAGCRPREQEGDHAERRLRHHDDVQPAGVVDAAAPGDAGDQQHQQHDEQPQRRAAERRDAAPARAVRRAEPPGPWSCRPPDRRGFPVHLAGAGQAGDQQELTAECSAHEGAGGQQPRRRSGGGTEQQEGDRDRPQREHGVDHAQPRAPPPGGRARRPGCRRGGPRRTRPRRSPSRGRPASAGRSRARAADRAAGRAAAAATVTAAAPASMAAAPRSAMCSDSASGSLRSAAYVAKR